MTRLNCWSRLSATVGIGLCLTGSVALEAQTPRTVSGVVLDSLGVPVRYARVEAGNAGALASDSGRFLLMLESTNAVTLEIRRIGYRPVSLQLSAGGDTSISIMMYPTAQRLTAVEVIANQVRKLEVRGFYERMADRKKRGGSAQFLTPEDIERRHPHRATQLLEGLNGVTPRRGSSCTILVRCWVATGPGNCIMTVYLDGQRLEPAGDYSTPRRLQPIYIDDIAHVADISAIEVYQRPTQAPPQYQSDAGNCGLILIWTK
jgi:hypothetical protein